MTKARGQEAYRKLILFYIQKIKVHFTTNNGNFYNGTILDISESKLTLVLEEDEMGVVPFLLEEINPNSIKGFKPKEVKGEC